MSSSLTTTPSRTSSRRGQQAGWLVAVVALLLAVAACGGKAATSDKEKQVDAKAVTSFASPSGATVVPIVIKGSSITPSGTSVKAKVNGPIQLQITADVAGELHVHSSPEQHVEFPKGTSETTLTFDQPGVIDVEDHKLDKLIVQLEVR